MDTTGTITTAAPWESWVEGLTAETFTAAVDEPSDGRVTYAEYLERFDSWSAECTPFADLAEWMRSINQRAGEAEAAFGITPVYRLGGTRAFHPHTLAWVIDTTLTPVVGMGDLPTGAPKQWRAYDVSAPIVRRTADQRAMCEPWREWEADAEFIHRWM